MAIDRQGTGLFILRILIGTFFLFEGIAKLRWFIDPSLLTASLTAWQRDVAPGSISAQYLGRIAFPHVGVWARLVPLGEISSGLALIFGVYTPLFAFVAFFMALNFHVAGGTLFRYSFLTNGYGLPVLGGTLALAFGGVRLPFSLRR